MKIKYILESLINNTNNKEMNVVQQHLQAALIEVNRIENKKVKKESESPSSKWKFDLEKGQLTWNSGVQWKNPLIAKNIIKNLDNMIDEENVKLDKQIKEEIPNQQLND